MCFSFGQDASSPSVDEINHVWKINGICPFIPQYEVNFRKSGQVLLEKRRLFPGYVFIESEMPEADVIKAASNFIPNSKHVYRMLHYDDAADHKSHIMKASERQLFMRLWGQAYCIAMSKGRIVGDKVNIVSGPLLEWENAIERINRHRSEAIIALEMMGEKRRFKVGLEIAEKA